MTSEVVAALLGAVAAGLFQTLSAIYERRRRRNAMLVAIASEVDALCSLIRTQGYLENVRSILAIKDAGTWDGHILIVDIRSDYFSVFDAMAAHLGDPRAGHARDIVRFYAACKSAIDSLRPDGPLAQVAGIENRFEAMASVEKCLQFILQLGDEIVMFPKHAKQLFPADRWAALA